jgi:hypothetical protein
MRWSVVSTCCFSGVDCVSEQILRRVKRACDVFAGEMQSADAPERFEDQTKVNR